MIGTLKLSEAKSGDSKCIVNHKEKSGLIEVIIQRKHKAGTALYIDAYEVAALAEALKQAASEIKNLPKTT